MIPEAASPSIILTVALASLFPDSSLIRDLFPISFYSMRTSTQELHGDESEPTLQWDSRDMGYRTPGFYGLSVLEVLEDKLKFTQYLCHSAFFVIQWRGLINKHTLRCGWYWSIPGIFKLQRCLYHPCEMQIIPKSLYVGCPGIDSLEWEFCRDSPDKVVFGIGSKLEPSRTFLPVSRQTRSRGYTDHSHRISKWKNWHLTQLY